MKWIERWPTVEELAVRLDKSMRYWLKGRVRTSLGAYWAVTTWKPPRYWERVAQIAWPKWMIRELFSPDLESILMSTLRKLSAAQRSQVPVPHVSDEEFERSCPGLHEHLTAAVYPDGTARQTSTLLIFSSEGQWKACLRDRDNGLCLWASSSTVDDLWDVLEGLVSDPRAIWRLDKASGAPAASRVEPQKRAGQKRK